MSQCKVNGDLRLGLCWQLDEVSFSSSLLNQSKVSGRHKNCLERSERIEEFEEENQSFRSVEGNRKLHQAVLGRITSRVLSRLYSVQKILSRVPRLCA